MLSQSSECKSEVRTNNAARNKDVSNKQQKIVLFGVVLVGSVVARAPNKPISLVADEDREWVGVAVVIASAGSDNEVSYGVEPGEEGGEEGME